MRGDSAITNMHLCAVAVLCYLKQFQRYLRCNFKRLQNNFFSPWSLSRISWRCGCGDEQCLQKMCFPEYGFFTAECQILIQCCLQDEDCQTFQHLSGFPLCPEANSFSQKVIKKGGLFLSFRQPNSSSLVKNKGLGLFQMLLEHSNHDTT